MDGGAGGLAQMVLPGKMPMNGEWKPLQDGYQVVWSGGPEAAWKIAHDVGRYSGSVELDHPRADR